MAVKVLDVDLSVLVGDHEGLEAFDRALVLLRWRGVPVGEIRMSIAAGRIAGIDLVRAAAEHVGAALAAAVLEESLSPGMESDGLRQLPACSVVIPTRNRPDDLARCLESICASRPADVEVIVVDNAPSDDRSRRLAAAFPVQYLCEPRPGVGWARRRGARAAQGEVVVYADDDVVVDRDWVDGMRRPFLEPHVGGVTGLVMPQDMLTPSQELFEAGCGFRRYFTPQAFSAASMHPLLIARVGAGASMAFRRRLIFETGLFDVEMDCGTVTRSGGDHYAFYLLLKAGHTIAYTPQALSWHRHRIDSRNLAIQLHGYSVGAFCLLLRCLLLHGELGALRVGGHWFVAHHLRELWRGIFRLAAAQPLRLTWAEIRGAFAAPWAHIASRRIERTIPIPTDSLDVLEEAAYET